MSVKKKSKTTELRVASYTAEPSVVVGSFFNGVDVPSETNFDIYKHKKSGEFLVHGENQTLDYNGVTDAKDDNNDYLVALYDPVNKAVELYKSPFINGKVTSKSKRVHKGPSIKHNGLRLADQRKALGEAFGTKKAKSKITSMERNRIDADKLRDLEMDIIDNVKESTQALPTAEELSEAAILDRPTPKANEGATNVEDIYALEEIIPSNEWSFLRIGPLLEEEDDEKRMELLPCAKSTYISTHLPKLVAAKNTEKLQLLYYASILIGVYKNKMVRDKKTLMERLQDKVPEPLIDGVLERFTIARASKFGRSKERSFMIDPHHEDKLLCYLLAIIFHIDNFMVEVPPLAQELNMKPARLLGLFKALGAHIKAATVAQAEAFGLSKRSAATYKIARLKVPFKLPEMSRRGRRV